MRSSFSVFLFLGTMANRRKSSCTFPQEDISFWDFFRVLSWLRQSGLHDCLEVFNREKIDGRTLIMMTEYDIQSKRGISEKSKKKMLKALARYPGSQISGQPGFMSKFAHKLKKTFGSEGVDAANHRCPPPVPEADYLAMNEVGEIDPWESDFSDSDYEEPPEEGGNWNDVSSSQKIRSIQEKFRNAGFMATPAPAPPLPPQPPEEFDNEEDGEDIYDAPEPDMHSGYQEEEEDMYIPPNVAHHEEGGVEVYEVPGEVEPVNFQSKPWQKPRKPGYPIPPRQPGRLPAPPVRKPASPTGPPPPMDFEEDDIYDTPAQDEEEGQHPYPEQPPPPRSFPKPNLANRGVPLPKLPMLGLTNRPPPSAPPPRPISPKPVRHKVGGYPAQAPAMPPPSSKKPQPPPLPSNDHEDSGDDVGPGVSALAQQFQLPDPSKRRPPPPGKGNKPYPPKPLPSRETKPVLPSRGDPAPPRPPKDTKPNIQGLGIRTTPPLPSNMPPPRPTAMRPTLEIESDEEPVPSRPPPVLRAPPLLPSTSRPFVQREPEMKPPEPSRPWAKPPPPAPIETRPVMRPAPISKGRTLDQCQWYHGGKDRKSCEQALSRCAIDGCYIVRNSSHYQGEYSLSLFFQGEIKHLRIRRREDGRFAVGTKKSEEKAFVNVIELIEFHQREHLQLVSGGLTLLSRACPVL